MGSNKVIYSLIGQHFESKISNFYDDLLVNVNTRTQIRIKSQLYDYFGNWSVQCQFAPKI